MEEYWNHYIRTNIIGPLENALQGKTPEANTDDWKRTMRGRVWYVSTKNGKGDLLRAHMRPYVEEYLFERGRRMCESAGLDETWHHYWQRAGTSFVWSYLMNEGEVASYFDGKRLNDIVESWIGESLHSSDRLHEHRALLLKAVCQGYSTDWKALQTVVVPELTHGPSDYEKVRLEYFCILDAIIKVMLDEGSDREQKVYYLNQINQKWDLLSAIYSVMTGKLINTGFNHFSPVLGQFKGKQKEYATLMVAALRHHPQVLVNYKSRQIRAEIEKASREIKQNTELNDLCRILFPRAQWGDYDLKSPRLTTAEMMQKVRESEELKQLLQQVEEYARALQSELDDAIKMQSLCDALKRLDPATARAIFAQLDMVLEGNNEVWDKNRLQLKKEVNLRYEKHQRMIEGTHQQAQLAADYSKQAATSPRLITNHFEKDSVRFEAGSTMNGNVTTEEQ